MTRPGLLTLGPVSLPVSETRAFAVVGVVATLLLLAAAAAILARSEPCSEGDRIAARYGDLIVRASTTIPDERWVTNVPDIEALVQVARRYDRVILMIEEGRSTTYLVDDGVAVYRYTSAGAAARLRLPSVAVRS